MIDRPLFRALLTSAALASAVILAGCNAEQLSLASNAKANKPIPEKLLADMQAKEMDSQSPILVRLFKQEAELEVWKQDKTGKFALLKTYPICRWSGDLGPKVREGDRQAPEGFYSISPTQMNPQSAFYLSFNMGYPNAFDKALGRTGSQLMVHGDCSSRGCYAMTDEQISEIYTLGREAFFGGQRAFQVQAYPFRMTPVNMAKHRNNPNMPFWKMIKQGNDHFEVTREEPRVEFCENKYVFNPEQPPTGKPLSFVAGQKCPIISVAPDVAEAVLEKQQQDEAKTAELIARGTPVAQRRPDIDGGMNKIFASKIPDGSTGLSEGDGASLQTAVFTRAPGTIPPTVNPPKSAIADDSMLALAPTTTPTRVASASSSDTGSGSGFFSNLAKRVGIGGSSDTTAAAKADDKAKAASAKAAPKPADPRQAAKPAAPQLKPSLAADPAPAPAGANAADPIASTLAGGSPATANATAANSSFESRFGSFR